MTRKRESGPSREQGPSSSSISEAEILALCCRFLEAYGDAAEEEARCRRDRLLADDDFEGYLVWSRIAATIGSLQRTEPILDTFN